MIGLFIIIAICLVSLGAWANSTSSVAGFNVFKDFVLAALATGILWYNHI